ncbi:MAG: PilZ domain-containing protein [Spirochaetes bacterium]|nr:PilZ domain-containing protein [Spirochaetota bacterium]MBU0954678.1 PilZ domain-containing protein [Spirochaetota bacterium]
MSIATSQQINRYYETFRSIDVTFTKEVIKASGLIPQNVFIKCLGEQWPCVVYSSSFEGTKILATAKPALIDKIKKANNLVNIRFSFKVPYKQDPVSFFVAGRVSGFAPYAQSNGSLQFINVQYSQRPPEDFVEIIGNILEANINSARRRDERIIINADAIRRIGLAHKEAMLLVQGVPRRCIIRDLSFGGAKVIIVGLAKFLVGKDCVFKIDVEEPRETLDIAAKVVRSEDVEGRKDLAAIALQYDDKLIPMSYKMHVNNYNPGQRKSGTEAAAAEPPAVSAATAAPAKSASAGTEPKIGDANPASSGK